jgi:diguanylate cyclase (GGDEF)-like protein
MLAFRLDQARRAHARILAADEIAMSDSEIPPHNPEPDPAPVAHEAGAVSPVPAPAQTPAASTVEPHLGDGAAAAATATSPGSGRLERIKRLARGRRGLWAGAAVLIVAAGTVGSVLGAHAVARNDATNARQAFRSSSTGVSSTLKQAIQHEEDLVVSTSTFFAANPKATSGQFGAWSQWAHAMDRYPELQRLVLMAFLQAAEPVVVAPRITSRTLGTLKTRSSLSGRTTSRIVPVVKHPTYYCVAVAGLARGPAGNAVAGSGHCALTRGLMSARDSGLSGYAPATVGHTKALSVVTPVYKGGTAPSTVTARRGAFVGWLREVLAPGVLLQQALRGHADAAARLRHRSGSSNVVFAAGSPQTDAQSATTNLQNGWSVRIFGAPAGTGVLADSDARALLIAGVLLSALLGLLAFLLGGGRALVLAPEKREPPREVLYDELTGLPNRALMLDRAQRMLARAGRESGLLTGALFIDIDWFNDVTDKIGEAAGDQLLTIVAERLETVVRAQDSVGRLGGDEFVVLVESAARGARLDSLARRVIEALHKPVELDDFGPSFFVTASIGVSFGRYATADDLLRDARLAMYSAKAAGKDRYTLFNANMRSVTESRSVLEAELNTALHEKQLFLLYEPIYDLSARKVAALEAQVRWMHPAKGVVPPEDFIPLAEETGLIVPIGRWMLEEACARAAAWNVAGNRVGMSVKVSANQLNREGFVTDVRRALQQSGIEPSLLTLEIAESTVMHDVAAASERLREIKQLGVRIAIDDFGSAYAYHSDLQRLPLDFLKVDRRTLGASEDEDYRRWLLEAILILGRDLSLAVIANGIETHEQMTALQVMGCAMAQGPFMGKPTPADAVGSLFAAEFPTAPISPPAAPASSAIVPH